MERFDILVIGGGAAGMAAACSAAEAGASVLLAERERVLGGVLLQCLHRGFGRELTGPEYAARLREKLEKTSVRVKTGCTVLKLNEDRSALLSEFGAVSRVAFQRCVLAAGSRETPIGALPVAGARPAGVFTAGQAQKMVNLGGYEIGNEIVILGSGDVGQIMAREFARRGKRVAAMVEQRDRLGGLARNRRDCVAAYRIPVRLRCTVDEVLGEGRVTAVAVRELDTGRRETIPCDTLVTALGLIPERELAAPWLQSGRPPWLHFCGNCEKIYELADTLTARSAELGRRVWP